MVKNPPAKARDAGSILESGRFPGGRNGNRLQYSYLKNAMDRGAWQATVHGVTELDRTEELCIHAHTHTSIVYMPISVSRYDPA